MASMRRFIAGMLATLFASVVGPAFAQAVGDVRASAIQIEMFDVEEVPQLTAGTQLNFTLFGTPGVAASVQIDGARRGLALHEVQPGIYEGSYSVDAQDRLRPDGRVVAILARGSQSARALLQEPLQIGAAMPVDAMPQIAAAPPLAAPSIATPPQPYYGAPPPRAGAPPVYAMPSVRAPTAAEPLATDPMPLARPPALRRVPGDGGDAIVAAPRYGTPVPAARLEPQCADCAVVESVRIVEVAGPPGVLGVLSGGLLGAILGNQIGHGDLRGFARIVGAVGGALAGREIERSGSRRSRYDVVLRLPNGAAQIRSYDTTPPYRVGERVRIGGVTLARASRSDAAF
ncbi:MAG: glycine zipper 2TM domain-containing protein [Caldimonas sp.]